MRQVVVSVKIGRANRYGQALPGDEVTVLDNLHRLAAEEGWELQDLVVELKDTEPEGQVNERA